MTTQLPIRCELQQRAKLVRALQGIEVIEGILTVYNPPICNSIWVRPQDLRALYHEFCYGECNDVIYVFCQIEGGIAVPIA